MINHNISKADPSGQRGIEKWMAGRSDRERKSGSSGGDQSQYDILRNPGHDCCEKDEFSASHVVSARLKSLLLMDARVNQVPR